jgi:hypothetical protein
MTSSEKEIVTITATTSDGLKFTIHPQVVVFGKREYYRAVLHVESSFFPVLDAEGKEKNSRT